MAGATGTVAGQDAATSGVAHEIPMVPPCSTGSKPTTLFVYDQTIPSGANALIVDKTGIYIGAGLILKTALDGGSATILAQLYSADSFAITGSFLWVAGDWGVRGLRRLPIDGTPSMFAPAIEGLGNIAASDGLVFYTKSGDPDVVSYGVDLTPGPTIHATDSATLVKINGSDVFISTATFGSSSGAKIEHVGTNGGATSVVATSASSIVDMAANLTSIYWIESGDATTPAAVRRAAYDGSNPELVANLGASSVAADEAAVYLSVADGSIVKIAADTLQKTTLAEGQTKPSVLTQYGPRVYWINDRPSRVAGAALPTSNAVMTACK